jgi:hypothetical protein
MKWKAITPKFTVSEDWNIWIEKDDSEPDCMVTVYFKDGTVSKSRLFCNENEADNFIRYLTNDDF